MQWSVYYPIIDGQTVLGQMVDSDRPDLKLKATKPNHDYFLSRLVKNPMILSGTEIQKQIGNKIIIDPFDESRINPNSYNLTLHEDLMVYTDETLDMMEPNEVERFKIPPEGFVLEPNRLYLARTVERTETTGLVPMIEGRSSIGRLGLFVHVTAGFGDVGFKGFWTLEMFAVQPIRIYAGVEICQIFYHEIAGDNIIEYAGGKYHNNDDIQPSLLFKELTKKTKRETA